MENVMSQISDGVLDGNMAQTRELVQAAIDLGKSPDEILHSALIPAMDEVGHLFEVEEYYVPEMLLSARAMQAGLDLIKPLLAEADVEPAGRVVIGTVSGDLHDIGKNLVAMMLEGAGFEVHDLGVDVSSEDFLNAVYEKNADIVAISAMLTTTMLNMEKTIKTLESSGLRDQVKIIIGGAPVTYDFAEQIGADGHAPDASQVARLVRELLARKL